MLNEECRTLPLTTFPFRSPRALGRRLPGRDDTVQSPLKKCGKWGCDRSEKAVEGRSLRLRLAVP